MAEPVSWLVLELVKAMVEQITVANGYRTDLGAGLVTLDTAQEPEDATPYTVIAAGEMPIDEDASGPRTLKSSMEITVEFAVPFGANEIAELLAHRARADLLRALRAPLRGAAAGINSLVITGSRIGPPDDGASVVIAQVTARAGLTETLQPATP